MITNRRDLLSIAGKAFAVAAVVTPAALSAAPQATTELQHKLILWAEAVRAYTNSPDPSGTPAWGALLDASDDRRMEAMEVPAVTAEDMAIKAYLALHYAMGGTFGNAFDLDYTSGSMADDGPAVQVVADAKRLSPLVASIIQRGNA